jgi:hypothetical protein
LDQRQADPDAIEDGRAAVVIAQAEEFADASPEERYLSLTFLCHLESVKTITHGDPFDRGSSAW